MQKMLWCGYKRANRCSSTSQERCTNNLVGLHDSLDAT